MMATGLCGLTALAACGDSEGGGKEGDGTETPQPDAAADDAGETPDTSSDASDSDASTPDAEDDAGEDPDTTVPAAAAGTCYFTVDGSPFETAVGDLGTLSLFYSANGNITIQCGVRADGVMRSVNLSVSDTKGPGTYNNSVLQYSEQLESGGAIKQWRKFSADVALSSASESNVTGTSSGSLPGTEGTTKEFSLSFNLTPTVK